MAMLLLVLANAIITASIKHSHKEVKDKHRMKFYKNIEVIFKSLKHFEKLV